MRQELVERAMRGDREAFTSLAGDVADRFYAPPSASSGTRTGHRTPHNRR